MTINSALDQPLKPTEREMRIFDDVDSYVSRSIAVGDPLIALEYGRELLKSMQVTGVALAKMLYKLNQSWDLFTASGFEGTFKNMASEYLGRAPETIEKYVRMWSNVFESASLADDVRQRLMGRSIEELLTLTAVAREGYDLAPLADLPNKRAMQEKIRELRGEDADNYGKTRISIFLVTDDHPEHPRGTLYAMNQGIKYAIGHLKVESESEVAQNAITRIINAANILER